MKNIKCVNEMSVICSLKDTFIADKHRWLVRTTNITIQFYTNLDRILFTVAINKITFSATLRILTHRIVKDTSTLFCWSLLAKRYLENSKVPIASGTIDGECFFFFFVLVVSIDRPFWPHVWVCATVSQHIFHGKIPRYSVILSFDRQGSFT